MARNRKFLERRCVRNQLKTYLENRGWLGLNFAEGFSKIATLAVPSIAVLLSDLGPDEINMGRGSQEISDYDRRIQIEVYMEDEDRVSAITEDISDFMDMEPVQILDSSSNFLGTLISDTSSILSTTFLPDIAEEANLEWRGVVVASYAAHYIDN